MRHYHDTEFSLEREVRVVEGRERVSRPAIIDGEVMGRMPERISGNQIITILGSYPTATHVSECDAEADVKAGDYILPSGSDGRFEVLDAVPAGHPFAPTHIDLTLKAESIK